MMTMAGKGRLVRLLFVASLAVVLSPNGGKVLADSIPIEECPLIPKCCEEDCCGKDTAWVSPQCVLSPGSEGFTGTYSNEHEIGCCPRACCEEDCCGDGLIYDNVTSLCVPTTCLNIELVSATSPHVANGADNSFAEIMVMDCEGNPFEGREIITVLYTDIGKNTVFATDVGAGKYESHHNTTLAGSWSLVASDLKTGIISNSLTVEFFGTGNATKIELLRKDPIVTDTERGYALEAVVTDEFLNLVSPPNANVQFNTTLGILKAYEISPEGRFLIDLLSDGFGTAVVTATDKVSGLSASIEVLFPAIALPCNATIYLTGSPDDEREFEVPVLVFVEPGQELVSYTIDLSLNNLTGFVDVAAGGENWAPPNVEQLDPDFVHISQTSSGSGASGVVQVATLIFECLGEGDSVIDVANAQLVSNEGTNLVDMPVERAVCPNKDVKEVSVNIILVKGKNGEGGTSQKAADTKKLIKALQDALDKACCKIRVKSKDVKEIQDDEYKDGLKSEFSEPDGKIKLTKDEIKLLERKNVRDDECVNVYLVKSLPESCGESIQDKETDADGNVQDLEVLDSDCKKIEDTSKLRGVIVQDSADEANYLNTFMHEVGHMLGLEHSGFTTTDKDDGADNVMKSGTGNEFVKQQCEIICKDAGGFLKELNRRNI